MQELIEAVNKHYSDSLRIDIFDTNPFLEKEKEQIIDAYYGKIDGVFGYREEGQEYYNETYNQNK